MICWSHFFKRSGLKSNEWEKLLKLLKFLIIRQFSKVLFLNLTMKTSQTIFSSFNLRPFTICFLIFSCYLASVPGCGERVVNPHPVRVAVWFEKSIFVISSLNTGKHTGRKNFENLIEQKIIEDSEKQQ